MRIVNCGYNFQHPSDFKIHRPNGSGNYLLLIVRSPAFFLFENKIHYTNGNAVVIYEKDIPQEYGSHHAAFINDWIHFECDETDLDFLSGIGITFNKILEFQSVNSLSSLVKQLYFEKISNNKNAGRSATMYLNLLMLKISDLYEQKDVKDTVLHKQLSDLKHDIYLDPQKDWKIGDIAKTLSISCSYLQHQYKEIFGINIKKDITISRIEHSKFLLSSTDYSLAVISNLCGYENDVHFMRVFKKVTGLTPTQYRKNSNDSR